MDDVRLTFRGVSPCVSSTRGTADVTLSHDEKNSDCLIASDDNAFHQIVTGAARLLTIRAIIVRSGNDAITWTRSRPWRLALIDQSLPDVCGLEVARVISLEVPRLPFVLLGTGLSTSITVEAMRDLGIAEGSEVTVVIKASDVMLAVD